MLLGVNSGKHNWTLSNKVSQNNYSCNLHKKNDLNFTLSKIDEARAWGSFGLKFIEMYKLRVYAIL